MLFIVTHFIQKFFSATDHHQFPQAALVPRLLGRPWPSVWRRPSSSCPSGESMSASAAARTLSGNPDSRDSHKQGFHMPSEALSSANFVL